MAEIELTEAERESLLRILREEAVALCKKLGCTCEPEPVMTLTNRTFGPHKLRAWTSEHSDDCALDVHRGLTLDKGLH